MGAFETSDNKDIVRGVWDFCIIQQWTDKLRSPLSYLGLPGPQIKDVVVWKEFISSSTGVERVGQKEDDRKIRFSIDRYVSLHSVHNWQLLRGDIEDIILEGKSIDGIRPMHSFGDQDPLRSSFRYTLVNLDFYGGLAVKNSVGGSRRVEAIKKLMERQRGTDFLLLITLQGRDNIDREITHYLTEAQREAADRQDMRLSEILGWYAARGKGEKKYKLKALVPLFIRKEAETSGFDCFSYPIVAYVGTGNALMVHFVFELLYKERILHAFSKQTENDLISMPLVEVQESQLRIASIQHPDYDASDCQHLFSALPLGLKDGLLTGTAIE